MHVCVNVCMHVCMYERMWILITYKTIDFQVLKHGKSKPALVPSFLGLGIGGWSCMTPNTVVSAAGLSLSLSLSLYIEENSYTYT